MTVGLDTGVLFSRITNDILLAALFTLVTLAILWHGLRREKRDRDRLLRHLQAAANERDE